MTRNSADPYTKSVAPAPDCDSGEFLLTFWERILTNKGFLHCAIWIYHCVFSFTSVFNDLVHGLAVQGRHHDVRKGLQIDI